MRKVILAAALFVFAAIASFGAVSGAEPPIRTPVQTTFQVTGFQPGTYDLVQLVVDFPPNASTFMHAHPDGEWVTVLEGHIVKRERTNMTDYGPGQSFYVAPNVLFQLQNIGTAKARVIATLLVPPGIPQQSNDPNPPPAVAVSPAVVGSGRTTVTVPAQFTLLQWIMDFDPGANSGLHVMNHAHVFSMLEGENTFRYQDGAVERYTAGQQAVMTVGRPGAMENSGTTLNRFAITWIIAGPGDPFSPVGMTMTPTSTGRLAAPSTGDGGLADDESSRLDAVTAAIVWSAVLVAGFLLVARRRARTQP